MIRKTMMALSLLLCSQLVMAQTAKYEEGKHFFALEQAPAQGQPGVVDVTEIFSYACSHCNTFEPYMQSWKKTKPENVKLTRLPVVFGNRSWELLARGYITAEMMGIAEESHVAMMDAIWKERKQFRDVDQLAEFYSAFGVEEEDFKGNFKSFAADSQLRKGQQDIVAFGVSGTPTIVVNHKYRIVNSKHVPNYDVMLDVVDFLVAEESVAAAE